MRISIGEQDGWSEVADKVMPQLRWVERKCGITDPTCPYNFYRVRSSWRGNESFSVIDLTGLASPYTERDGKFIASSNATRSPPGRNRRQDFIAGSDLDRSHMLLAVRQAAIINNGGEHNPAFYCALAAPFAHVAHSFVVQEAKQWLHHIMPTQDIIQPEYGRYSVANTMSGGIIDAYVLPVAENLGTLMKR